MKITIVGSGNVGKLFGGVLAGAGQEVALVDIREDLVKAIEEEGITVETPDQGTRTVRVAVSTDVRVQPSPDLVVIAVKGHATRAAMESAMKVVGPGTYVMSVQNGAGNVEAIAAILKDDARVIGGVFLCVITTLAPSRILWVTGTGGLKIGPFNGQDDPMVEEVAALFTRAGIETTVSANVQDLIWNKLLLNTPLPLATVLGLSNDELLAYPSSAQVVRLLAAECAAVAQARGIRLANAADPVAPVLETLEGMRKSGKKPKCSMLQDMEAGRKTEIDTLTGSIVREGRRLGIPTPVSETIMLLVRAKEERMFRPA